MNRFAFLLASITFATVAQAGILFSQGPNFGSAPDGTFDTVLTANTRFDPNQNPYFDTEQARGFFVAFGELDEVTALDGSVIINNFPSGQAVVSFAQPPTSAVVGAKVALDPVAIAELLSLTDPIDPAYVSFFGVVRSTITTVPIDVFADGVLLGSVASNEQFSVIADFGDYFGELMFQQEQMSGNLIIDVGVGGFGIALNQILVPEPSCLALFGIGATMILYGRQKRSQNVAS